MLVDGLIANWLVPRELLPRPNGFDYEAVAPSGDSLLSLCFVRQPISDRARAVRIPQVAVRLPICVDGRPASLLHRLALSGWLATAARLLTGLPTEAADLTVGAVNGDETIWAARCGLGSVRVSARPGLQAGGFPALAADGGFHLVIGHRPTVASTRGKLRPLSTPPGFGSPVPARAEVDATSWLDNLVPGVDDWSNRCVAAWFVTPTPPTPVPAQGRRNIVAAPC